MPKRFLAIFLMVLFLCPQAGFAAAKIQNFAYEAKDHAVAYSFTAEGFAYIQISYKSSRESGILLAEGENGAFSGEIALPLTYAGNNVIITLLAPAGNKLGQFQGKTAYPSPLPIPSPAPEGPLKGITVCIDPGHQLQYVPGSDPIGPGLKGNKKNVYGMAEGTVTRRKEAVVVLEVSLMLRDMLLAKGAQVVLTRDTMDTALTNLDRANITNDAGAHITLRLHANSNKSKSNKGIVIYGPLRSDYAKAVADTATYKSWGQALLDNMQAVTGAKAVGVYMTDTYVGNNWCKMPVFLVELGYMSNPEEDLLLSMPQYQQKLSEGMASGVEAIMKMRNLIP